MSVAMATSIMTIATLLVLVSGQSKQPCTTTLVDPSNNQAYRYSFDQMMAANPSEYCAKDAPSPRQVDYPADNEHGKLNLCGTLTTPCGGKGTPLCLSTPRSEETSLGTLASWSLRPYQDPRFGTKSYSGGVTVTISGGGLCSDWNSNTGEAYIFLKCNPTVTTKMKSVPITDIDPATNTFTPCRYYVGPIEHAAFCPNMQDSSGFDYGWVFVIIVLCGFFLYFVLGIIILKCALHKEGREVFPNHEFWASLPGLVWDGVKFLFSKFRACCCSGGYESV